MFGGNETAHRAELVWSVLVLIRRWLAEGRPVDPKAPKLGMFEGWSQVIGGILLTADIRGFLGNLEEFYDASDAEGAAWRAFTAAWCEMYAGREVSVSDVFGLVEGLDLGDGGERSQKIRLGKMLRGKRDRRFGDFVVRKAGLVRGMQKWKLEEA